MHQEFSQVCVGLSWGLRSHIVEQKATNFFKKKKTINLSNLVAITSAIVDLRLE